MKHSKIFILLLVLSGVIIPIAYAERPTYVYDFAKILSKEDIAEIDAFCVKVDINTTAEIVCITWPQLGGASIEDKAEHLFNDVELSGVKGIGKADKDNGVLILLTLEEKEYRIEVGYGLEGDLTDVECKRIGEKYLVPHWKEAEWKDGFLAAAQAIAVQVGYGSTDSDGNTIETIDEIPIWVYVVAIIIILIIVVWLVDNDIYVGGGSYSSGRGGSSGGSFGGGSSGGGGASGGFGPN